jgi:hypothetical protein
MAEAIYRRSACALKSPIANSFVHAAICDPLGGDSYDAVALSGREQQFLGALGQTIDGDAGAITYDAAVALIDQHCCGDLNILFDLVDRDLIRVFIEHLSDERMVSLVRSDADRHRA